MEKRKRKNDETIRERVQRELNSPWPHMVLGLSLAVMVFISLGEIGSYLSKQLRSLRSDDLPRVTVPPRSAPLRYEDELAARRFQTSRETTAHLVFSATDGNLWRAMNGRTESLGVPGGGRDVTADANGALAYIRLNALYILRQGRESKVELPEGNLSAPAWSPDGKWLAIAVDQTPLQMTDTLYRVNATTLGVEALATGLQLAAPPIINPATGRILIAERIDASRTQLYTLHPLTGERRDLAIVQLAVAWADYHPSATAILLTDTSSGAFGDLYVFAPSSSSLTPVGRYGMAFARGVWSPDGQRVAAIGTDGWVYVVDPRAGGLTTPESPVRMMQVNSLDWVP